MGINLHALAVLTFSLLAGCVQPGSASSAGACALADGSVIDTYTVFAKWKKVSGYSPVPSAESLKYNYDLLLIEPGSRLCQGKVKNGSLNSTAFRADYENDVDADTLTIDYIEGQGAGSTRTARYSFSGSCNGTRMTLTTAGATPEVYELFSSDIAIGACNPSQQ